MYSQVVNTFLLLTGHKKAKLWSVMQKYFNHIYTAQVFLQSNITHGWLLKQERNALLLFMEVIVEKTPFIVFSTAFLWRHPFSQEWPVPFIPIHSNVAFVPSGTEGVRVGAWGHKVQLEHAWMLELPPTKMKKEAVTAPLVKFLSSKYKYGCNAKQP